MLNFLGLYISCKYRQNFLIILLKKNFFFKIRKLFSDISFGDKYRLKRCYIYKTYLIFLAKLLATAFSLYVVDQFTPLVDAKLYQSEEFFNP